MPNWTYSVAIRTLGNAGEKYQRLLQSIVAQSIPPEEIIVAIPNGYELDYTLGIERIVRCPKGMTHQRAASICAVKSDYILIVDDDVEFESTMVENLYSYLVQNDLDCCLPMSGYVAPNDTRIDLRYPLKQRIRGMITGQLITSLRKSSYMDVLTKTAGHKIYVNSNQLDKCYLCTTACFQCFFIKSTVAKAAHLEDELWLDGGKLYGYASCDEPVFFSKLNQFSFRMAYAFRVNYKHLDAKVGHQFKSSLEDKKIRYYSIARNRTIYWYKFIYQNSSSCIDKLGALMGGIYGLGNYAIYTTIINLLPKHWVAIKYLFLGYKEAWQFIHHCRCGS